MNDLQGEGNEQNIRKWTGEDEQWSWLHYSIVLPRKKDFRKNRWISLLLVL